MPTDKNTNTNTNRNTIQIQWGCFCLLQRLLVQLGVDAEGKEETVPEENIMKHIVATNSFCILFYHLLHNVIHHTQLEAINS